MAIVGCSYFKGGIYNNNNGTVTYSDQAVIAKLVRMQIELEDSNDNDFYADNAIDETDNVFAGGNYEVNTNDLTNEMAALILGLKTASLGTSIQGITDEGVKEVIYDDDQLTPYMGIGNIVKHKRGGVDAYTAIVLPKVQFKVPSDAWETQGKTISWQTPTIQAKIFKSDATKHPWKYAATFSTEQQAVLYINARLPEPAVPSGGEGGGGGGG